jgi:hypothetical protein
MDIGDFINSGFQKEKHRNRSSGQTWFYMLVIILAIGIVIGVILFMLKERDEFNMQGDKRSFDVISQEKRFGPLTYVDVSKTSGAANYTDEKYSYWFNQKGLLISRVLINNCKQELIVFTLDQAYNLAMTELTYYINDPQFSDYGWTLSINTQQTVNTPWEFNLVYMDAEGVILQRYDVIMDSCGQACLMFLSVEEKSPYDMTVTEGQAIELSYKAISEYLLLHHNMEIYHEDLKSKHLVCAYSTELFAFEKNTIWSVHINSIELDDGNICSFFVQINAVTGETIHTSICR